MPPSHSEQALKDAGLDPDLGPAIQMTYSDHKDTETWDKRRKARAARIRITEMLRRGDHDAPFQSGIEDVRSIAGTRHNGAIAEAERYYSTWRPTAAAWTGDGGPGADAMPTQDHADVTLLVNRLTHHLEVLDQHTLPIQLAYEQACESLAHLRRVWGGDAAQEFLTRFGRGLDRLERYLAGARRMRGILEERLMFLREADRRG